MPAARALLALLRAPSRWLDRRIDARVAGRATPADAQDIHAIVRAHTVRAIEGITTRPSRGEMVWISERVASQLKGCRIVREVGERPYLVTDAPPAYDALRPSPPQAR